MTRVTRSSLVLVVSTIVAIWSLAVAVHGQSGPAKGEWRTHGGDLGNTRYAPLFFTTPSGQRGALLRAYDKKTGKDAGAVYMPAPQSGSPMTYMLNGRQFIVVAISGGSYSGELLAFRLPEH